MKEIFTKTHFTNRIIWILLIWFALYEIVDSILVFYTGGYLLIRTYFIVEAFNVIKENNVAVAKILVVGIEISLDINNSTALLVFIVFGINEFIKNIALNNDLRLYLVENNDPVVPFCR